jgi:hypothetical protein
VSDDRTVLLKALVAGDRIADRVSQTDDGVDALFGAAGAIAPPYDPEVLLSPITAIRVIVISRNA